MKVMILAAGRGERMRPLTDETPKPLLKVDQYCLIEHHIDKLKKAGFNDIIINTAWLADKIHQHLGDGAQYGVNIYYSDEKVALETGGGIKRALPLLGDDVFLVVNGDVWCNYDFSTIPVLEADKLAHLVLVDNPAQHPAGDFSIENGLLSNRESNRLTYSGIGLYRPALFADVHQEKFPLAPLLRNAADEKKMTAEYFPGFWSDIGTPERLSQLREKLR